MTKENARTCILAGYDVRTMSPFEVYELAGRITDDRILRQRADCCRVPASQGARDRVAAFFKLPEHERHFTNRADAESDQLLRDMLDLGEVPNYEKALASMSQTELAALRTRVGIFAKR